MLAVLLPSFAFADVGDVNCTAKQFTVTNDGLKDQIEKPLTVEQKNGSVIRLGVEIEGRAYILSGDLTAGDFILTQVWGPEYHQGINTTGSFTSTGRMQISMVDEAKVFKLVCTRVSASDFPKE